MMPACRADADDAANMDDGNGDHHGDDDNQATTTPAVVEMTVTTRGSSRRSDDVRGGPLPPSLPQQPPTLPPMGSSSGLEEKVAEATAPARQAVYRFFYPNAASAATSGRQPVYLGTNSSRSSSSPTRRSQQLQQQQQQTPRGGAEIEHTFSGERRRPSRRRQLQVPQSPEEAAATAITAAVDEDEAFVHRFWTTFDDILILSIFTQLGILFRLGSSSWYARFDNVFSKDSSLFINLPLNCMSCFIMGLLCSGERLMEIIHTRFSPPRTQHDVVRDDTELYHGDPDDIHEDDDDDHIDDGIGLDTMESMSSQGSLDGGGGVVVEPSFTLGNNGFGLGARQRRRRGGNHRRRRHKKDKDKQRFVSWQPPIHLNEELRDVQLLALERRIRMSKCLVLFPVRNEDVDVMEHYFRDGYKKDGGDNEYEDYEDYDHDEEEEQPLRQRRDPRSLQQRRAEQFDDLVLEEGDISERNDSMVTPAPASSPASTVETPRRDGNIGDNVENDAEEARTPDPLAGSVPPDDDRASSTSPSPTQPAAISPSPEINGTGQNGSPKSAGEEDHPDMITEFTTNVQENVQENIDRFRRVNIADGWDRGTTPEAMSDDLMLGLRDGFCGALSSFSSWNSSMISLMRNGQVGEAFVGYMLGLQLPIIAYRFGQHVAVYIFVWRARRETHVAERRGGYGIRVAMDEDSERVGAEDLENGDKGDEDDDESEVPSVRAIVTAVFIMAVVTQCTSISFFRNPDDQQVALSLLFSPLGVLARWRLSKLNKWKPTFPIGTFTANLLACALSGSLGSLLAGNPGPRERIVLVSFIAGFGGTLSSLATFVVEILAGVDPILFRFDGFIYAVASIGCAVVVGFVFSASVEWADETANEKVADMTVPPETFPPEADLFRNDTEFRWY